MNLSDYKRPRIQRCITLFHNLIHLMTRTSIEACAKAFIAVVFIMFVYSVYRVGEMIGFWG